MTIRIVTPAPIPTGFWEVHCPGCKCIFTYEIEDVQHFVDYTGEHDGWCSVLCPNCDNKVLHSRNHDGPTRNKIAEMTEG